MNGPNGLETLVWKTKKLNGTLTKPTTKSYTIRQHQKNRIFESFTRFKGPSTRRLSLVFAQDCPKYLSFIRLNIVIMKFLEYTPLDRVNDFLNHLNLGERTIKGCLEAHSCKHTRTDKRLSLSLEHEILDYLGKSLDNDSSPAEFLLSRSSRKTLIYLVLALYHIYPDYDFSAVKAHEFFTEETWDSFKQIFDTYMFEASKEWSDVNGDSSLVETLYKALDEVVKISECEIYSYNPDCDADPFLEKGAIWSFSFFFYNRKQKRVVSCRFSCLSNLVTDGYLLDNCSYEDDGEIFDDMDI
ncbi:hypothetical protein LWI28_016546 [Acer negundo]|uniref:Repressor of RNA polymerase III transcription n=1 Tax=Acer negundo TaxID=4023 RepID=A0AAD5IM17_ACENE|nr:hypothetical protein LWI28_016546 [Acer negundo]KAK4849770.1 hypothetical protein QYF36_000654 [Acer negundo]